MSSVQDISKLLLRKKYIKDSTGIGIFICFVLLSREMPWIGRALNLVGVS
jgi:hypothetical protein